MNGDLVSDGSSQSEWVRFDQLMTPVRNAAIPVLVALGNHDYWGDNRKALEKSEIRFPQLGQKHWYERTYGNLGLVFLDSNKSEMSVSQWNEQISWFNSQMSQLQADSAIKGVFVFTHHPPYTNSTTTGDETDVQDAFVGTFSATEKAIALISGHAHTYEHFNIRGKTFIVSGGGGGPRVKLLEGAQRRHEDLFSEASPRPFNYLKIAPVSGAVRITVMGLDKGASDFHVIDEFILPMR